MTSAEAQVRQFLGRLRLNEFMTVSGKEYFAVIALRGCSDQQIAAARREFGVTDQCLRTLANAIVTKIEAA